MSLTQELIYHLFFLENSVKVSWMLLFPSSSIICLILKLSQLMPTIYGRLMAVHVLAGAVFDIFKSAKANYKRALRHKESSDFNDVTNLSNDCLLACKDHTAFWNTWWAKFAHNGHFPGVIDASSDPTLIANKFADLFEDACTLNSQAADHLVNEFVKKLQWFLWQSWTLFCNICWINWSLFT